MNTLKKIFIFALLNVVIFFNSLPLNAYSASAESNQFSTNDISNFTNNDEKLSEFIKNSGIILIDGLSNDILSNSLSAKTVTGLGNEKRYYTSDFSQFQYDNNCGPTLAANVLSYFKTVRGINLYSGDITQELYDIICTDVSYSVTSGTSLNNVANGIKIFAKRSGKTAIIDKYWLNTWSDVTRDINANKPVMLSYNNHAWLILGYQESNGNKKLFVSTGWSNEPYAYLTFTSGMQMQSVNIY